MALAADNNSSSETLFVSSGILSCVSVGTVGFTDLPKKMKKIDFITFKGLNGQQLSDKINYIWFTVTFLNG